MNKNKEALDFIIKCSLNEKIFCDYFEIRDSIELSDEELSIAIKELKKENKIVASVGEYLPKKDINKK